MKREEALHLTNHHYRLYSSVRPVVDTSPPVSMYSSPKSIHYKPALIKRPASCQPVNKKHGKDELNHFLAKKNPEITPLNLGFNAFVRSASAININELRNTSTMNKIQSKLKNSGVYQAPVKYDKPPLPKPRTVEKERKHVHPCQVHVHIPGNEQLSREYYKFKDYVLDLIILRGVFTDSVIKDCFTNEIEKRDDLDRAKMERIMSDTLRELGVQLLRKQNGYRIRASTEKPFSIPRSGSLSSLSSEHMSSNSSKASVKDEYQSDSSSNSKASTSSTESSKKSRSRSSESSHRSSTGSSALVEMQSDLESVVLDSS
ncbi:unnamed protein product [Bursaphelenchus okinawaensis]|uniref:Uncharacterized protein n=1 Tax=Bursaphelenchus okinawaensis TaxID=465554 RepID=A0A811L8Q3_9BILA|nr:unnamed protein product [Bursaphelenchus okinawaensis]CAG9119602.1 unnamed protein product [Bursaphelenchus okinawaensis]